MRRSRDCIKDRPAAETNSNHWYVWVVAAGIVRKTVFITLELFMLVIRRSAAFARSYLSPCNSVKLLVQTAGYTSELGRGEMPPLRHSRCAWISVYLSLLHASIVSKELHVSSRAMLTDRSASVPMTLNDTERRDERRIFFWCSERVPMYPLQYPLPGCPLLTRVPGYTLYPFVFLEIV